VHRFALAKRALRYTQESHCPLTGTLQLSFHSND
jgi:hypothetical protein